MKIYYGLTKEEANEKYLKYENTEYLYKGVNTSLDGLRKLIEDNKLKKVIIYYTIIVSSNFEINTEILEDKEYNMIAVNIPFVFKIEKVNKLF